MTSSFGYQTKNYTCGTHAFINAANALGKELRFEEAKALVDTTYRKGTSIRGLIRGVKSLELIATIYRQRDKNIAWRWLSLWANDSPIIALVDNRDHWLTITGKIGRRLIVVDPSANVKNGENGVYPCNKKDFMERWAGLAIKVSAPKGPG